MLGETSADSPSLLGAQIQRHVFFLAIGFPQTGLLRLTDDGQNLGDGQPHHLDLRELVGGTACHLSYSQKSQLRFQLLQLIEEFGLALGPKLVDLELSHDEKLLQSERAIQTTLHRELEDTRRKRYKREHMQILHGRRRGGGEGEQGLK
jgi:hypothetical protein